MRKVVLMAAVATALAGCPTESEPTVDAGIDPPVDCKGMGELTVGPTTGLLAMGEQGALHARVIAADKVPPELDVANPWTVEFTDAAGEPVTDVEILMACAYMPAHAHGMRPRTITPLDEPGRFKLDHFRFSMAGDWELQFALRSKSAPDVMASAPATRCGSNTKPSPNGNEYLAFKICIPDE